MAMVGAAGGRIVYHQIFSWDPKASSVAKYTDPDERSFHRMADLLSPEAMRAERILRLLPLTTRAPIDCPVLQIFGHERLTDWLNEDDFKNWGEKLAYGLGHKGYYVDVFPASEIPDGTVTVDADGVNTPARPARTSSRRASVHRVAVHPPRSLSRTGLRSFPGVRAQAPRGQDVQRIGPIA